MPPAGLDPAVSDRARPPAGAAAAWAALAELCRPQLQAAGTLEAWEPVLALPVPLGLVEGVLQLQLPGAAPEWASEYLEPLLHAHAAAAGLTGVELTIAAAAPTPAVTDLDRAWAAILTDARARIGDGAWDTWLSVLRPVSTDGERIWAQAPDHARVWIERQLLPVLSASATRVLGRELQVALAASESPSAGASRRKARGRGAVAAAGGPDLLPQHLLERQKQQPAGLLPAAATIAAVPAALLCARGREDAEIMGRHARYAQHPSQRPGELTPRDVLCASTLLAAVPYARHARPRTGEVAVESSAAALWRALDPVARAERRPGWGAIASLRATLSRVSAFLARYAPGFRVEVAVEPGLWLPAHEAPDGFGTGGRRATVRLCVPADVAGEMAAWQQRGWAGTPPAGLSMLRLDHLRRIRCASELATYVIFDALPAVDRAGRQVKRRDLQAARSAGGARRFLRLSGKGVGELGDRLGIRHRRQARRAQRLMLNLTRLAQHVAPERFGRPSVRMTAHGVVELVVPLRDTSRPGAAADTRRSLQELVDEQLRRARAEIGALVAFPEHLAPLPGRGPPAA
jgi:hypothetical protein